MTNVVDFEKAKARGAKPPEHPIVQALDALALALADHGHSWSEREVSLYETAISYCGCKDSGSSA